MASIEKSIHPGKNEKKYLADGIAAFEAGITDHIVITVDGLLAAKDADAAEAKAEGNVNGSND